MNKHLDAIGKGEFVYDYKYDIFIFKIKDRNYKRSVEFQNFVIDIDDKNFVTGIRIFDASKVFMTDKILLRSIFHVNFKAEIKEKIITVTINFAAKVRNKIIPLIGEKQNFTQQITTPVLSQDLGNSSVAAEA